MLWKQLSSLLTSIPTPNPLIYYPCLTFPCLSFSRLNHSKKKFFLSHLVVIPSEVCDHPSWIAPVKLEHLIRRNVRKLWTIAQYLRLNFIPKTVIRNSFISLSLPAKRIRRLWFPKENVHKSSQKVMGYQCSGHAGMGRKLLLFGEK